MGMMQTMTAAVSSAPGTGDCVRLAALGGGAPLRILIVDDSPVNQMVAAGLLASLGFRPDVVADGTAAITAVQRREYDLIFMDIQMPGMDGFETTQRITRVLEGSRRPRIVALTAADTLDARQQCFEAGMDDFILKPVRMSELAEKLMAYGGQELGPSS